MTNPNIKRGPGRPKGSKSSKPIIIKPKDIKWNSPYIQSFLIDNIKKHPEEILKDQTIPTLAKICEIRDRGKQERNSLLACKLILDRTVPTQSMYDHRHLHLKMDYSELAELLEKLESGNNYNHIEHRAEEEAISGEGIF